MKVCQKAGCTRRVDVSKPANRSAKARSEYVQVCKRGCLSMKDVDAVANSRCIRRSKIWNKQAE